MAALVSFPACADIAAFNKAVKAGDYKTAAAEAATTWPTLDKAREDISLIAREFGYAAYIAGDFPAAQAFAQFEIDHPIATPDGDVGKAVSTVLLQTAGYRMKANAETRTALANALSARAELPGFDNVTFLGVDALVAPDMERGKWKDALSSTALGLKLANKGGGFYLQATRRLELHQSIADYMNNNQPATLTRFATLEDNVIADMDAAKDEAAAARLQPFYWEVSSWLATISAHIISSRKSLPPEFLDAKGRRKPDDTAYSARVTALLDKHSEADNCRRVLTVKRAVRYPSSAMYAGFVGSVILKTDIGADGKAQNPVLLTSVPEKSFGEAVMIGAKNLRFAPDPKKWSKTCEMAHKGHILQFEFIIMPY